MAFSIFASGTGKFTTGNRRHFRDEGDVYDTNKLHGKAADKFKTNMGGANKGFTGTINALGKWTTYGTLRIAVSGMAMLTNPQIIVDVHNKGSLLGMWDAPWSRYEIFLFEGASVDAKTNNLLRCLKKCRLNRWGYALGIAGVVSDYSGFLSATSGNPNPASLHIQIET